jgi:hypothetical protein
MSSLSVHQVLNNRKTYLASKTEVSQRNLSQTYVAIGHGIFCIITGLWPILSIRTFEKVTGPKTDKWLVKTVGSLIAVSGSIILRSGLKARKGNNIPEEVKLFASGVASCLGVISLIYSLKGRISKIYLLDALTEAGIVGAWIGSNRT